MVDGRYKVVEQLGAGAMGVVYRAEDVSLGRMVALKVIEPGQRDDADAVERFKKEARTLAQVRHENVVHVYTFGPHGRSFYLAMEYVAGRGLDAIIEEHAAREAVVPRQEALVILRQIALGLSAVHARSIVHRDIKPSNIVVEQGTGRPVLIDFGLARRRSASNAKLSMTGGTPCYMAPEQATDIDGTRVGPAADVYALACTAFELLTGRPVFTGGTAFAVLAAHLRDAPPPISSVRADLAPLDGVLARALAKAPEDRYPSCGAFIGDFEVAARRLGSIFPPAETSGVRRRVRVLVLEQDESLRRQLVRTIERALCAPGDAVEVECVALADALLEAFASSPADIVIVDDEKVGRDGTALLRAMRSMPGGADAEALLLSRQWVRDAKQLTELRARELPKPISTQALASVLARLGALLAERRARKLSL
jgi:serine/threonine-protein kinase